MEEPKGPLISKTHLVLSLFAVSGWLAFYMRSSVPAKTTDRIVYKDREIVKEKIVTKDIIKTVTRPDGTKIVTVSKATSKAESKIKQREETKEKATVAPAYVSRYSLGFSVIIDYREPLNRQYQIEISRRLWVSPIWAEAAINSKRELTLGLRWEF